AYTSPHKSFSLLLCRPPTPTLFPYTTLFRSDHRSDGDAEPDGARPGTDRAGALPRVEDVGDDRERRRQYRGAADAHQRAGGDERSEEHTSELQSLAYLVCRLLLEKKKRKQTH